MVGGSNPLVPTISISDVPLILLTNDDGIDAEGLVCLEEALADVADLVVVAPDRERSAVSHGLTIHAPLSLRELGGNRYALDGTPADCVIYALRNLVTVPPLELLISGINHGANLGDDIMYSGTVAAAREASRHGIPAIAVSQAYEEKPVRFTQGAKFIRSLVVKLLARKPPLGICLNINIPPRRIRGVKVTRHGCSPHYPHFNTLPPTEIEGEVNHGGGAPGTVPEDFRAILDQYISITPLQRDQTDYGAVQGLIKDESNLLEPVRVPGLGLIGWKN